MTELPASARMEFHCQASTQYQVISAAPVWGAARTRTPKAACLNKVAVLSAPVYCIMVLFCIIYVNTLIEILCVAELLNVFRPSAIQKEEITVPSQDNTSPTRVVIKTNPLFGSALPKPHPQACRPHHVSSKGQRSAATTRGRGSEVAGQEVFYGQRKKIRKTKEQEMISIVMDVTKHSKKQGGRGGLLQKVSY